MVAAILVFAWLWPVDVRSAEAPPAPRLDMPIRCTLGETCWVVMYVDWDPTSVRRDYRCGSSSSNGQRGTAFAIRDLEAMRKGVEVGRRRRAPWLAPATA